MTHEEAAAGLFRGYAGEMPAEVGTQRLDDRYANRLEAGRPPGRLDRIAAQQIMVAESLSKLAAQTEAIANRLGAPHTDNGEIGRPAERGTKDPADHTAGRLENGVERIKQELGSISRQLARLQAL